MIGWGDIYKVVEAMLPLYVALGLGYGSVKWWRVFTTPEQCEGVSKLVSCFCLPFFTLEFTLHIDPFGMNYRFIAADAISKLVIVLSIAAWAKCSRNGSYRWSITTFSLSTLTNSLVVGVPLLNAMYGRWSQDLVVQGSVFQALVWLTLLLFVLEVRKAGDALSAVGELVVISVGSTSPVTEKTEEDEEAAAAAATTAPPRPSCWSVMKVVWLKLALNPNSYASIVGILSVIRGKSACIWTFQTMFMQKIEWHFGMPKVMEGSILIMSKAGTGLAMFSMGLFMAQQKKIIDCGPSLTAFGMVLRFIAGPAAMAIGSLAVGLHGDILRVAIIQAALPQSITSFIFAREYGLHASVLSTAVIFGMLVSLPVLVAYYVLLGFIS